MSDGRLKSKKQDGGKEFQLTGYEYDFLKAVSVARNNTYNQYQNVISSFLAYLAGSKWGIKGDEVVDFELDDERKLVKVTPHIDNH